MSSSEGSSSRGQFSGGIGEPPGEVLDELAVFAAVMARRPVRVTYALIGLYIVLFGLCELWGGSDNLLTLVAMGAEVPSLIQQGQWWRLLSATALHGGLLHILLNSYVLYSFGPFLEKLLGWPRFVVLYVVAGLAGTVLGTIFGDSVSVGASGSLFGLLGAAAVLGFRDVGLPTELVAQLRKGALINLGLNVVASLRPNVDWLAHLGGFLAGALLLLLAIRPQLTDDQHSVAHRIFTVLAVLLLIALLSSSIVAIVQGQPWQPALRT